MKCKNCSGQDFAKISDDEFKCKYCGTKLFLKNRDNIEIHLSEKTKNKLIRITSIFFVVILFSAFLAYFFRSRPVNRSDENISGKPRKLSEFGGDSIVKENPPLGKFDRVSVIPDSIGNIYFAGIYSNIGKTPVAKPEVAIILYSKMGRKIASGHGYGIRNILLPGEETPVSILISNAPEYFRYEIKHTPKRPYSFNIKRRAKIILKNTKLKKGKYSGYVVIGDIYNIDDSAIKYMNLNALLFDKKKKIIGFGTGYLKEKNLKPNDYSPFKIKITTVVGKPKSFKLDYNALLKK
ncbi:hypothetical protein ACFL20_05990 [Spirochaetota bacterium]